MASFENFNGKSVLVTGAGRGIGRAIATKFYSIGATVYALSNDTGNLATLKSEGPSINIIDVDLADWSATRKAVENLPTIDHLVNCAGICPVATFEDTTQDIVDRIYNVNFRATVNVSQVFVKKLTAEGKKGSIVNISTTLTKVTAPLLSAWSSMYAAVDHLTRNMAVELAPVNIRVNALNLGAVLTQMMAEATEEQARKYGERYRIEDMMKRIPSPNQTVDMDDIVNTVFFLLSDAAGALIGNTVVVDAGYSIA